MALLRCIALSIVASVLATALARRLLAVSGPPEHPMEPRPSQNSPIVVVVPILTGNSNNRIGWVREEHHHHHSLFARRRR
jgi:hypothetical protein